jgi:hypothetical protein
MCCRVALSFVGDGRSLGGFLPLADEGGKVEGRGSLLSLLQISYCFHYFKSRFGGYVQIPEI